MTTQIYPSSWSPSGGLLTGSLSGAPPQGTLASTSSTEFYYTGTGFTKTAPWASYTITVVVAAGQVVPGMNELTGVYTASSMVVEYFNGTSWNPLLSVDTGISQNTFDLTGTYSLPFTGNPDWVSTSLQFRIRGQRGNRPGTPTSGATIGIAEITLSDFRIVGVPESFDVLTPTTKTLNIGDTAAFTTLYTGTQPTANGPAGSWTSTTGGGIYTTGVWSWGYSGVGATLTFTQSSTNVSKTASLTFNTASVTAITTNYNSAVWGETLTVSGGAPQNASGTYNSTIWSATGSITPSSYTAPGSGASDTIYATLTGTSISATKTIALYAPSAITSFLATTNPVLYGGSTNITPTFTNGTGSVDQSVGSVTSGTPFSSGTITASKTFTLTVTNPTSRVANNKTQSITLTPQTVAVGTPTPSSITVSTSTPVTYSAVVTGAFNTGVTWSNSGGSGSGTWNGSIFTPTAAGSITITATSIGDPTKSSSTTLTVSNYPVATSLTPSLSSIPWDGSFTLAAVYSGGVGLLDWGLTCPATGNSTAAILASTFTGSRTYTLTVTNSALGISVSTPTTVTRQTVSVGAISPVASTILVGGSKTFSGGVVSGANNTGVTWSATGGSFSGSVWTAPAYSGVFTIMATSQANTSVSASTTISTASLTNLNGGNLCTIGGGPYVIYGSGFLAGVSSVTIGGQAASYGSITDTTISGVYISPSASGGYVTVTVNGLVLSTTGNVAGASISGISGTLTINEYGTTSLSASVSGLSNTNVNWSGPGSFYPTQTASGGTTVWTPPSLATSPLSYTITAAAAGSPSTTTSTTVTVYKSPLANSLTTSASSVAWDGSFTLTPQYLYGTGAIDQGVSCPTSGSSVSVQANTFTGTRTYTLSVTNPVSSPASPTSVSVTRQAVVLGAITPANQSVSIGQSISLTVPSVTWAINTNITWTASGGSFSSATTSPGVATTWYPPNLAGSYTITARSVADTTKAVTTTITVPPTVGTFTLNGGAGCNIGSAYTITGTGLNSGTTLSISINGIIVTPPSGGWAPTPTTISNVLIPSMSTYGNVAISITIDGVPQWGSGIINTPSLSAITPSNASFNEGTSGTFSATASNLGNTGISWSSTGGSWIGNAWAAPVPTTTSQTYIITATATGNSATVTTTPVTVYKYPIATSLTPSPYPGGSGTTGMDVGSQFQLTPLFSFASRAYIGTTSGGAEVTNLASSGAASYPITVTVDMDQMYYLSIQNAKGATASASSSHVTARAIAVSNIHLDGDAPLTLTAGDLSLGFLATVVGATDTTVTWSSDGIGGWSGNKFRPSVGSITGTPYVITATSTVDPRKYASQTIMVYEAPALIGFTAMLNGVEVAGVPYGSAITLIPTFTGAKHSYLGTTDYKSTDIGYDFESGHPFTKIVTSDTTFYFYIENNLGVYEQTQISILVENAIVGAIQPASLTKMITGTDQGFSIPSASGDVSITWTSDGGYFRPLNAEGKAITLPGNPIYWTAPSNPGTYTITASSNSEPPAIATKVISVVKSESSGITETTTTGIGGVEGVPRPIGNLTVGQMIYVGPGGVLTQDYQYVRDNCRWVIAIGRATAVNKFIFAPNLPMDQKNGALGTELIHATTTLINGSYRFDQTVASDLWTIPHSLNRYFNVVKVYDTSTGSDNEVGFEIPRDVTFEGPNIMVIRLISPSKGYVLYS